MDDLSNWLVTGLLPASAITVTVWWFRTGPSKRTRNRVEIALEARGLKIVELNPKFSIKLGRGSKCLLVARAENAFGNKQVVYFHVDIWADIFSPNPQVDELVT